MCFSLLRLTRLTTFSSKSSISFAITRRHNHYNRLGINRNATNGEIKTAFRKKSLDCHPDKFPGNAGKEKEFEKLNDAYQTLSDDSSRRAYDAKNFNGSNSCRENSSSTGFDRYETSGTHNRRNSNKFRDRHRMNSKAFHSAFHYSAYHGLILQSSCFVG